MKNLPRENAGIAETGNWPKAWSTFVGTLKDWAELSEYQRQRTYEVWWAGWTAGRKDVQGVKS